MKARKVTGSKSFAAVYGTHNKPVEKQIDFRGSLTDRLYRATACKCDTRIKGVWLEEEATVSPKAFDSLRIDEAGTSE